jgi:DNA-binding Xre family transcriptional regulator
MLRANYLKLRHKLLDHNIKITDLKYSAGISGATLAKINKDEPVSLSVLLRICEVLDCNIGDIVNAVPEESDGQFLPDHGLQE